ncbi:MAG: phosphoribosylglycinamide formyltransferase [Syntrophomonadaceae bacterium]|nr:phosphoribosylglycinamide formyltransferase [Syntrophomonadaceae bacterium]
MKQVIKAKRLNLGVMASGRGSNFDAIYTAIERKDLNADIKVLISDKKDAPVLKKAEEKNIPAININPQDYASLQEYEAAVVNKLLEYDVDILVLAGYMRLVGSTLLSTFPNRILNIHPSLLPAFKGLNAQKQALDYGVKYTGCTVHIVDEGMDTGPIIMQAIVPVYLDDTEEILSKRILEEEHQIYWRSLQLLAEGRVYISGRKTVIKE